MIPRSGCAEIDPQRPELGRARGLRRPGVDVHPCGDVEIHESGGDDRRPKLRLLKSAGNSAFPEIDVASGFVAHGLLDQNVADLKPAARLEHASHLL